MSIDVDDIVKTCSAQILHLNCQEDKDLVLGRLKEDVPEFYELVKNRIKALESPESSPPGSTNSGVSTGDGVAGGRFGVFLSNLERLMDMLRRYGVWASISILLIVCALLGYELNKANRKYEGLLHRLAQASPILANSLSEEEVDEDQGQVKQ